MQVIKRSALQYFASTNWKRLLSAQVLIPIKDEIKTKHKNPDGQHEACALANLSRKNRNTIREVLVERRKKTLWEEMKKR